MLVYTKAHFVILLLAGIRSCEGDGVPTHLRSRHLDVATNNLEKNKKTAENTDAHNAKDDGMAANEKLMSFVGLFKGVSENIFFCAILFFRIHLLTVLLSQNNFRKSQRTQLPSETFRIVPILKMRTVQIGCSLKSLFGEARHFLAKHARN